MKILDQFGIPRDISHLSAADRLFETKKKARSKPWPVIDECFKIFEATHPQKYESHLIYLDDIKQTRKDPKFASSVAANGQTLRYTIDIPVKVHKMLRTIYSPEELPMTREFWIEFARRYPKYRIAEKV
jgi:hypothetical protein